jgi:cytochrome oxidase Cu insertion factor (SCO1/SenC/PrrC family)
MNRSPQQRRSRWILWAVALIFFAPLGLAFLMYYGSGWRPSGHTNHGALIEPPRPLPGIALRRAEGGAAPAEALRGKWSLIYVGDGACASECQQGLYYMRQTVLSMGSSIPRMQRVFLATGHCCDASHLLPYAGTLVLDAGGPEANPLLAAFPTERRAQSLYIVDPRGNLMMRYDVSEDPKGLREDLKKLLDLSHIG